MNIAMVHPHDIYSSFEPWTVRVVALAKTFAQKGHTVKIIYFPLSREPASLKEICPRVVAIPFCRRAGIHHLIFNIIKLWDIARWAEIIHIQKCFYHAAVPAIVSARLASKPLHYDWDDWETKIFELSTSGGIFRNFIRAYINFLEIMIPKVVDTISVASVRLEQECKKRGIDEKRIFKARVGADGEKFNPALYGDSIKKRFSIRKPLVLYLGQLHGGQYVDLFIRAAYNLVYKHKREVFFMIVGDGYQAPVLKKFVSQLKLEDRIIFTGPVPHEEVPHYVGSADICVACFERNEAVLCKSPLKIAEYMASGKAIVASDVGEAAHMLKGAGLLTIPGDADSLAAGIVTLLDNERLRNELGKLARKRAEEEYNWDVTAANLLKAYNEAIRIQQKR